MLLMIRYIPLLVILICTIIKFCKQRRVSGTKDYRNLLVSLVSMGGYLLAELTPSLSFLGFRFNELSVGFFLVASGALSGKRLWSLIGAVWFLLHSAALFLAGQGVAVTMCINTVACVLLVAVLFYQNTAHKKLPLVLWIVLLAVSLISKNWGINITLLAVIVWFSPKFENKAKMPQSATGSEITTESVDNMEEKLAVLENLHKLLGSGAISKEEFEAMKKQLLGLPNTYSAPAAPQSIGKCIICGRENVPVESIEVVVAGMSRKRTMCSECAAKYKQPSPNVPPQQEVNTTNTVDYSSRMQQPSETVYNTAALSVPSQTSKQHTGLRTRIWVKLGIAAVLFVVVCVTLGSLLPNTGEPENSQEEGNPAAKAALEELVAIVKANNDSDAYQDVNGKAHNYFLKQLYVSANATSTIKYKHDEQLKDSIILNDNPGCNYPSLYLYADVSLDENGIMDVYYSFYVEYYTTASLARDRIVDGNVSIAVKDFSQTVDFNVSPPDVNLKAKWIASDMDISELGAFVKDGIRAQIFRMLDCILYVSDVSLEDIGFYEGIENDVPQIYYRGDGYATTEETTIPSGNEQGSSEELLDFLNELVPINNNISELHMTITFGVTMNGIVDYDQLMNLISEYTAVTELICTLDEEPITDEKIEIFNHYKKLIDRVDQFGAEYDSTTSESQRAVYWKNFHNYYLDWQKDWFALSDKYWSNAN